MSNGYAKKIRRRIVMWWCVIIGQLIWMVVVGESGGDSRMMTQLAQTAGRILYFGMMIFAGVRIAHNKKLLKDRLMLKEQALREHDERNRMLHRLSGGVVMDIMLAVLYLLTMTAAYYSMPVFYTAYVLLLLAAALKGGAYLAYSSGWMRI